MLSSPSPSRVAMGRFRRQPPRFSLPANLSTVDTPARTGPNAAPTVTDFDWAIKAAAEAGNFDSVYSDWVRRRKQAWPDEWPMVERLFKDSRQTVLYAIKPSDVVAAVLVTNEDESQHALGDIRAEEARLEENEWAADLSPALPMIMVFHDLMEKLGRVPLWHDVERHIVDHQELLLVYFLIGGNIRGKITRENLWTTPGMRAVRWRIGNAYYSFLREIHLIATLRSQYGLDVLYHPLIDAEWRADGVCGRVRIEVFIDNSRYKKDAKQVAVARGRKSYCKKYNPGLPVADKPLEKASYGGRCWLIADSSIKALAADIVAKGGDTLPPFKD